ncbi:MAG TPA: hypothetical protein VNO70_25280, partial [Blastocatellia bacterium]|nr:hypothetical protein [Blastocatellia bacterium]
MNGQGLNPQIEPLLLPFLQTTDEAEARLRLDQLIAHAAPIIKKITRWSRDPEDAFQEATQRVIKQLWDVKADPRGKAISNYEHYVRVVAAHVAKGQWRDERPQRRSLVDALRHVLRSKPDFALWVNEHQESVCGLAVWQHQPAGVARSERLLRLLDHPRLFGEAALPERDAPSLDNAELLAEIFNWVAHPIRFADLVRIVCDLKRVRDFTPIVEADEEEARPLCELLPDRGRRPDEEAEWGEFLGRLWAEVEQLPPLQRIAYLLNFTAADGQLELFWTYGVATVRRIGAVLQLTEEQFARAWPELPWSDEERRRAEALTSYDEKFALLWQHLPLTDATIAKMLGTERQKVINLRKA